MEKQRFYIDTEGNDDNAYREAIRKSLELAVDLEIKKIIFLIPTKRNVGLLERILGVERIKELFKGVNYKDSSILMKIETMALYLDNYTESEIVIACSLSLKDVLKIDDFSSVKAIIAIPWVKNELEKWIQTWSPTELRNGQQIVKHSEPSCIVKKAMEHLTGSINMSTGISNSSDEKQAKTFILALHKYEAELDPDVIGGYLVRELNWRREHAQDIEHLIDILNKGRYFQGGERVGLQKLYKQWKKECKI